MDNFPQGEMVVVKARPGEATFIQFASQYHFIRRGWGIDFNFGIWDLGFANQSAGLTISLLGLK
jgi:hypothetical protein